MNNLFHEEGDSGKRRREEKGGKGGKEKGRETRF